MRPSELRDVVRRLDESGPIHLKLEADLRKPGAKAPWYSSQKEHLDGWLKEYDGPGVYGRANWSNRSAEFIYNHFQCAPGLVWLAEALGVPRAILVSACEDVKTAGARSASQCGAFRRAVPWAMIQERIALVAKPESRFKPSRPAVGSGKPKPVGGYGKGIAGRK
ncbi:hypothetical protein M2323_003572 [Rhodoblastus acidophilus]|uniref:hypothetical protein n=1 Tax=Rhodoblastus acidophilus TaxID=1074 RepID=UPI0022255DB0|nr:hypothetical protein [Rhodoblastus acidophilus]MCW2285611.1 hypothetical protein [Rhodoblastus acidophilus]MCW2334631.1 hypothetical protein [Rhodoblastus acidophilus]